MTDRLVRLVVDTLRIKSQRPAVVQRRQDTRLAEMVAFARAHSPYYRELYRDLPERVEGVSVLPVTEKRTLMAQFDDWVTDREVTLDQARSFVADPDLAGKPFLGHYLLATTSGTSGTRGIFVLDQRTLAVTTALSIRAFRTWLNARDMIKVVTRGARMATVVATGGHFAANASGSRMRNRSKRASRAMQVLSVHTPLVQLVEQLNRFRPAIISGYASMMAILASEQQANRLRINPVLVMPTSEGLDPPEYDRIAAAFGAKVRQGYATTEFMVAAFSCASGWLHVNSDWLILEPVDAEYQPVPAGRQSHTVLMTNLANRVQPILRYDLGDSVFQRPDACTCGNPLPAIKVQGRTSDVLKFSTEQGEQIAITPLAIGSLVDRTEGVEQFQIIQTGPSTLQVRLQSMLGADPDQVWRAVNAEISRLLHDHQLHHVTVERSDSPPHRSASGKTRRIIPLT